MVFPITERQYELMKELKNNSRNFSQISRETGMDRSTISRTKNYLENKNIAEKVDRNKGLIYELTGKGRKTLEKLEEIENL